MKKKIPIIGKPVLGVGYTDGNKSYFHKRKVNSVCPSCSQNIVKYDTFPKQPTHKTWKPASGSINYAIDSWSNNAIWQQNDARQDGHCSCKTCVLQLCVPLDTCWCSANTASRNVEHYQWCYLYRQNTPIPNQVSDVSESLTASHCSNKNT